MFSCFLLLFLVFGLGSSSRVHGSDSFYCFPTRAFSDSVCGVRLRRPWPFIFTRYPACGRRSDACLGLGTWTRMRERKSGRARPRRSSSLCTCTYSPCVLLSFLLSLVPFPTPSPHIPRPIYLPTSPHIPRPRPINLLYIPPVPHLRPGPRASPYQTIRLTSVLGPRSSVLDALCFQKYDSTV